MAAIETRARVLTSFICLVNCCAKKKRVRVERRGWIGVQKLRTYPDQKTRAYERNDSPEGIEDYDIGVSYKTASYKGKRTCEGSQTTDEKHDRAEYAQNQSNSVTTEQAELHVIRRGDHDTDPRPGPNLGGLSVSI